MYPFCYQCYERLPNDGPGVPDTIGYREVSHLHASTNRDLEVVWVRGLLEEDRFRTRLPPSLETP